MKNAILCLFILAILNACVKESILTTPLDTTNTASGLPDSFDFELKLQSCFTDKTLIILDIEAPEQYGYLWEMNDYAWGHQQNPTGCHCGTTAKVRITRLVDDLMVEKSINLPPCSNTETN